VSLFSDWTSVEHLKVMILYQLVTEEFCVDKEITEFGALLKKVFQQGNYLLFNQEVIAIQQNGSFLKMPFKDNVNCRLFFMVKVINQVFDIFPLNFVLEFELMLKIENYFF
jgi:hypothetical protein